MTIKKRLFKSFLLILSIIVCILAIFFYSIINLNNIHISQNHRYEQIRKVEKIKELNTAFSWIVLDIIVDRKKPDIVDARMSKAKELFKSLWEKKEDIIINSETKKEKENLILIFSYLKEIEFLIKNDLKKMTKQKLDESSFYKFNDKFDHISDLTQELIIEEIEFLQNRLTKTEAQKEVFINKIKIELLILLFISLSLSFIISKNLINDIRGLLAKLNKGVLQLLSNDEDTIKINIEEKNELTEITDNINKYLAKKEDIIKSREELLRNISHELKTPITKGKFLLEKLKEKPDNLTLENINNVFYDIEELVNKLLQREKLNHATLNKSNFKITTLILESLSKLSNADESKVEISIDDDFSINGDLYYLTLAVKNLIDNAIKYTKEYPIVIITKNNTLYIKNKANQLTNGLTYYIQPFTREPNQQQGHGLGLNITNKILTLHNFSLNYSYEKPYNSFYISFTKP